MKKPWIEVVRFDGEDVIATSGGLTLTVSKFKNGTPGDLTMVFNGVSYTGMDRYWDLKSAMLGAGLPDEEWGNTDTGWNIASSGNPTIVEWYTIESVLDYEESPIYPVLNPNVKGTYKWIENRWKHQ